jgi:hypothetical protein
VLWCWTTTSTWKYCTDWCVNVYLVLNRAVMWLASPLCMHALQAILINILYVGESLIHNRGSTIWGKHWKRMRERRHILYIFEVWREW